MGKGLKTELELLAEGYQEQEYDLTCASCGSSDIYEKCISEEYEDYRMYCLGCGRRWVVEGPDA